VLVLIGAVAIGAFILAALRRRLFGEDPSGAGDGFIPLHDLRAMRQRGELSDEEYERLRAAMLGQWGVAGGAPLPAPDGEAESDSEERRAPPGYDLTGAPLPEPDEPEG